MKKYKLLELEILLWSGLSLSLVGLLFGDSFDVWAIFIALTALGLLANRKVFSNLIVFIVGGALMLISNIAAIGELSLALLDIAYWSLYIYFMLKLQRVLK